jgi:hypothetical protein|eukprot:COSAG02_NODE_142_length_34188_cov_183.180791_9_plen_68_part_00
MAGHRQIETSLSMQFLCHDKYALLLDGNNYSTVVITAREKLSTPYYSCVYLMVTIAKSILQWVSVAS